MTVRRSTLTRILRHDARGAATVEFAVIAPLLILGALSAADLGFMLHDVASLDHAVRVAAADAEKDEGSGGLAEGLADLLGTGSAGEGDAITVTSARVCACAATPGATVACDADCDGESPEVFFRVSATLAWQGFLLSERTLRREALVLAE